MAVDMLVMHPDAVQVNPGHPGSWVPGMLVDAWPAPRLGPGSEQHPRFIVVRIEDPITMADVEDLIVVLLDLANPQTGPDGEVTYPLKKKRVGYFDYASLNAPQMAALRASRDVTITAAQFNAWVKRNT